MKNSKFHFLKSVSSTRSQGEDTSSVLQWLKEQNEKVEVQVKRIAFDKMKRWGFDKRIARRRGVCDEDRAVLFGQRYRCKSGFDGFRSGQKG
jgi:hypothetical protein